MCRQYLAYKIPTSHVSSGKCKIPQGGRLEVCSCGKFTYAIVGRYRSKPDIIFVSKTNITRANKLYKKMYPFRVFKISKGFKDDGCCKTCGTPDTKLKKTQTKKKELDVETKMHMDLDSIIRYNLNLGPNDVIPEDNETGCNGDSKHYPFVTKKKLDDELKDITTDITTWKHFSREINKVKNFNSKKTPSVNTDKCILANKEYDLLYSKETRDEQSSDYESSEEIVYL